MNWELEKLSDEELTILYNNLAHQIFFDQLQWMQELFQAVQEELLLRYPQDGSSSSGGYGTKGYSEASGVWD